MAQAIGLTAIGSAGILSAGSNITHGNMASRMATMQSNQLEEAARATDEAAVQENAKAQLRAKDAKKDARLLQSRIIALSAANGGINQKSVMDNLLDVEEQGEYNSLMELYNGSSAAYELHQKAKNLRIQGAATRFEGKQTRRAGNMAAIGSLLSATGSATSFASKYNTGNTNNVPGGTGGSASNMLSPYADMSNTKLYSKY
jgi:hypothetical protein